jgi:ATP-dependent Lon protease
MGIKTIIIPELNKKDLADIPRHILKKIRIVTAKEIDDVLKVALERVPTPPVLPGKNQAAKGKAVTRRVVVSPGKGVTARAGK